MARMDEYPNPECDLYVEDDHARSLLREIIVSHTRGLIERCQITTYGAASVGRSLGIMAFQRDFRGLHASFSTGTKQRHRDAIYFRVAMRQSASFLMGFATKLGGKIAAQRVDRPFGDIADACMQVMPLTDHHDWVSVAASRLVLSGDQLWQRHVGRNGLRYYFDGVDAKRFIQPISDLLMAPTTVSSPTVRLPLFERSADAFEDQEPLICRPALSFGRWLILGLPRS